MNILPLPHDLDAEAACISSVFLDSVMLDEVSECLLNENDFYSDANRRIWIAIKDLEASKEQIDVLTVCSWLRDRGQLETVGGSPYLAQLVDATPAVAHVSEHAKIVADKALLRRMLNALKLLTGNGYAATDAQQWTGEVERLIYETARNRVNESIPADLGSILTTTIATLTERRRPDAGSHYLKTGWDSLDKVIGGFRPGKVYITAGRPGMGKSALAGNAIFNVASQGYAAIFITLEMEAEELSTRMVASYADVDFVKLENGKLEESKWAASLCSAEMMRKLPIIIHSQPGCTLTQLRSAIRRRFAELQRIHGPQLQLGLVVVDYLQLMRGSNPRDNRESQIAEISRELKQLSIEFKVAINALAQLNRGLESRPDKHPNISDLRDSGAIEQDADVILFPYRPCKYDPSADKSAAELEIAKQRGGPTKRIALRFNGPSMRFDDVEQEPDEFSDAFDGQF